MRQKLFEFQGKYPNIKLSIDFDDRFVDLETENYDFAIRITAQADTKYISKRIGMDLSKVFDQYLRDYRVPVFEYEIINGILNYRWSNVIDGFDMPLEVIIDGKNRLLYPTTEFKKITIKNLYINVDKDYYIFTKDLKVVIDS